MITAKYSVAGTDLVLIHRDVTSPREWCLERHPFNYAENKQEPVTQLAYFSEAEYQAIFHGTILYEILPDVGPITITVPGALVRELGDGTNVNLHVYQTLADLVIESIKDQQ